MTPNHRSIATFLSAAPLLAALVACSPTTPASTVDGQTIVPIDPSRPGDALFKEGLDLYRRAEAEQAAAITARAAGDAATEAAQTALALADYALAQGRFDALRGDPSLCPAISIRCDNAAYLAGRCSYEIGTIPSPNAPAALADAQARLDDMLASFPGSAFEDSAAYFDGRARFALAAGFGAASFADAEALFERSLAADASGPWADNAAYYVGRSEFELGYGLVVTAVATAVPLSGVDYDQARAWFDAGIAALGAFPTRFPTSGFWDNAAFYLARAWLEKPTPGTLPDPERVANLSSAVSTLGPVAAAGGSAYRDDALYWRGRGHYALSFHRVTQPEKDAESDLALADFHAVPSTSLWRDNALYHAVKADLRKADAAAACADYLDLATHFPASTYTLRAADALLTAAVTCP